MAGKKQQVVFERPFQRKVRPSIIGWLLMIFYTGAFGFYMWVRAAKTLGLGAKYEWCALHSYINFTHMCCFYILP